MMDMGTSGIVCGPTRNGPCSTKGLKTRRRSWFFKRLLEKLIKRGGNTKTSKHDKKQPLKETDSNSNPGIVQASNKNLERKKEIFSQVLLLGHEFVQMKHALAGKGKEQNSSSTNVAHRRFLADGNKPRFFIISKDGQKAFDSLALSQKPHSQTLKEPGPAGDGDNAADAKACPDQKGSRTKQEYGTKKTDAVEKRQHGNALADVCSKTGIRRKKVIHSVGDRGAAVSTKQGKVGDKDIAESTRGKSTPGRVTKKTKGSGDKAVSNKNNFGFALQGKVNESTLASINADAAPATLFNTTQGVAVGVRSAIVLQSESPGIVEQLAVRVGQAFANGRSSVTIRMDPPDLGEVKVVFSTKEGRLRLLVECSQSSSFHLLQQEVDQLEKRLTQVGIEHAGVDLAQPEGEQEGESFFAQRDDENSAPEKVANLGSVSQVVNTGDVKGVKPKSALDLMA